MNKIEQLINEYASITGRPVATISVSEYLEIKRYSEAATSVNIVPSDVPVASRPAASRAEAVQEPSVPETHSKPAKEASVTDIKTHSASEEKQERAVKLEPVEKKPKKSSAFAMMRSISG